MWIIKVQHLVLELVHLEVIGCTISAESKAFWTTLSHYLELGEHRYQGFLWHLANKVNQGSLPTQLLRETDMPSVGAHSQCSWWEPLWVKVVCWELSRSLEPQGISCIWTRTIPHKCPGHHRSWDPENLCRWRVHWVFLSWRPNEIWWWCSAK